MTRSSPTTRPSQRVLRNGLLRVRTMAVLSLLVAVTGAFAGLGVMSRDQRYVAAPGFACAILMLFVFFNLWLRDRAVPLFDVGFFCALATFVYSVYPLINYWQNGLEFSYADLSDTRLAAYAPTPVEIGFFHLRHLLYFSCLVLAYLALRGRGAITARVTPPPVAAQYVIVLLFTVLVGYFALLKSTTGVTFHTSYAMDDFAKNLAAVTNAPRWLLQVSGKLAGLLFVLKLALLYVVVSRCREGRWLIVLALWVLVEVTNAFVLKGARSGMILFLLATVLLYHRLVRPLSFKTLAVLGGSVFALFMFLGLYRSSANLATLRLEIGQAEAGLFAGSNEFQALLGTAYDVAQRKAAGATLPGYLYMNDIVDVLPPQQLLPFQKVTASEWYLREIGVSGTGQGYMWGVITQAIAGLDWIELALRGLVLGAILAWVHRWYRRRQTRFIETFVYVYLCIHVYYTFRNTTLSILANVVWEMIPFVVIVTGSAALLSRSAAGPAHASAVGVPAVRHLK